MKTIFTELLLADVAVGPLTLTGCRETATDLDRTNENSPALEKPMAYAQLVADGLATGNGAPSGAHYTLNLTGVSRNKSADMIGDSGRRIFVPLDRTTEILLSEGDFKVLDANGTDGSAALQLPNPDPDNDGVTLYSSAIRRSTRHSRTTSGLTTAKASSWLSSASTRFPPT